METAIFYKTEQKLDLHKYWQEQKPNQCSLLHNKSQSKIFKAEKIFDICNQRGGWWQAHSLQNKNKKYLTRKTVCIANNKTLSIFDGNCWKYKIHDFLFTIIAIQRIAVAGVFLNLVWNAVIFTSDYIHYQFKITKFLHAIAMNEGKLQMEFPCFTGRATSLLWQARKMSENYKIPPHAGFIINNNVSTKSCNIKI